LADRTPALCVSILLNRVQRITVAKENCRQAFAHDWFDILDLIPESATWRPDSREAIRSTSGRSREPTLTCRRTLTSGCECRISLSGSSGRAIAQGQLELPGGNHTSPV